MENVRRKAKEWIEDKKVKVKGKRFLSRQYMERKF